MSDADPWVRRRWGFPRSRWDIFVGTMSGAWAAGHGHDWQAWALLLPTMAVYLWVTEG